MKKRFSINERVHFTVEEAEKKIFDEDDIVLRAVVDGVQYEIYQEPLDVGFACTEICAMFKHFSDESSYVETNSLDLGQEYYNCQYEIENKNRSAQDLVDKFGKYEGFSMFGMVVLYYKKDGKLYCEITQNDYEKGVYKIVCVEEITTNILQVWNAEF